MMSIRESFEQRGERRGIIKVLLKLGKTNTEIIGYLMADEDNPLTREQAKETLQNFLEENQ